MGAHSLRKRPRVDTLEDRLSPGNLRILHYGIAHDFNLMRKEDVGESGGKFRLREIKNVAINPRLEGSSNGSDDIKRIGFIMTHSRPEEIGERLYVF